jgi:hypothetical protein
LLTLSTVRVAPSPPLPPLRSPGHRQYPPDYLAQPVDSQGLIRARKSRATTVFAVSCSPVAEGAARRSSTRLRYLSFTPCWHRARQNSALQATQPRPAFALCPSYFGCDRYIAARPKEGTLLESAQAGDAYLVERLVHAPERATAEWQLELLGTTRFAKQAR